MSPLLSTRTRYLGALAFASVGFAQLYRSPIEVVLGVMFLVSAAAWAVTIHRRSGYWSGISLGLCACSVAGRAGSALLGSAPELSGKVIVVVNWSAWAWLFAWLAYGRLMGRR